ncbi:MerR family transcriptional regulator, partial [Clostridioides difficile]
MFRIGEFSKLCKTTIKTLRYYNEVGLLKPEYIDDETNYRFYSTRQILELHHIQALRQIGLSIMEIKLIQDGHNMEEILHNRK